MTEASSPPGRAAKVIAFENVSKVFNQRIVLDRVSFSVASGEAVCILGRSGTGKSVMLKLMIGLMKADSGKVLVEGDDMTALAEQGLSRVRKKMGYMFQNAALFDSFTLHDNLGMPLWRLDKKKSDLEIEAAIQESLLQVGLEKDGDKMPIQLSGGMLKRAGLARALVLKPQILLADEPASGLDRITSSEITDLLVKVKAQRHTTMIIVTHEIEGARRIADRFAVLDHGNLIGLGTPDELADHGNELVKRLVG
jgi:phospholipid/cholesterol/gamma-HCH transport system ATP-binding protein